MLRDESKTGRSGEKPASSYSYAVYAATAHIIYIARGGGYTCHHEADKEYKHSLIQIGLPYYNVRTE